MFEATRFELSRVPGSDARAADAVTAASPHEDPQGGSAAEHPADRPGGERDRADHSEARTGAESGDRSVSGSASLLPQHAASGVTTSALQRLAEDMDNDQEVVDGFVSDYLDLLDGRLSTLSLLLSSRDDDAAVVSLLSLETTSAMIGATDVVSTAHAVRMAVEARQYTEADRTFAQLVAAVDGVRASLVSQGYGTSSKG